MTENRDSEKTTTIKQMIILMLVFVVLPQVLADLGIVADRNRFLGVLIFLAGTVFAWGQGIYHYHRRDIETKNEASRWYVPLHVAVIVLSIGILITLVTFDVTYWLLVIIGLVAFSLQRWVRALHLQEENPD